MSISVHQLLGLQQYMGLGWSVYKRIKKSENQKEILNKFKASMADSVMTPKEWTELGRALGVVSPQKGKKGKK